ncbi:indoleamine 2,3-dioxygenase 2-like isoform X2 [Ptychodera flava]|uniref:indoleamine 2,3-dioxygenase 2-like isoform X2 n=1 Tax=Ptychodera flava TaxID=63121 RepID=UPI00396A9356
MADFASAAWPSRLQDYHISEKYGLLLQNPLLSVLDHEKLASHRELRLAHLMLTGIAAGYVWGKGPKNVPQVLPKAVALPLWRVSEKLGIQPIISPCSWTLANWKVKDQSKPISDIHNRDLIVHIPGGETTVKFFVVAQQVELAVGPVLGKVIEAKQAIQDGDGEKLLAILRMMDFSLKEMESNLDKVQEFCDPDVFFNVSRSYMMGWESKPFKALGYDGLVYQGISAEPKRFMGGSAAQSPAIPIMDAILGVKHGKENEKFHEDMRRYMLPMHRRLIMDLRKGRSLKDFVDVCSDSAIKQAYNSCVDSLTSFRSCHLKIVVRFINVPLRRAQTKEEENKVFDEGTAGSEIITYLKSTRTATKESILQSSPNLMIEVKTPTDRV